MPVSPGCQLYFDNYDVRCNSFNCFNLFINNSVFIFLNGFICPSRNQRKGNFTAIYICINFNFDFFTGKAFEKRDIQFERFWQIGIKFFKVETSIIFSDLSLKKARCILKNWDNLIGSHFLSVLIPNSSISFEG